MHKTLRNPYHEETVGLFMVVTRELPQHLGKAGIICPGTDKTHSKDRI
jgi:hypothetical protein